MAGKKEDKKEAAPAEGAAPKSNKMLIIIVGLVALLIGGGGAGVAVMMLGGDKGKKEAAEETEKEPAHKKAIYYEMAPPFVVNYQWQGRAHYLQVSFAVMARSEDVIDLVREHNPSIRNNLMLLLAAQDFDGLRTMEGKESVRALMLDEIRKVLKSVSEDAGDVEQLYFINFVIQ